MTPSRYVLLVEDEPAHAEAIRRAFHAWNAGTTVKVTGTLKEYRDAVDAHAPDIVIMDINLPDGRAMEALTAPPESGKFPVVLMTSHGNEQVAVETMKAGALDYVVKSPGAFADMPRIVDGALREWHLLKEHQMLAEQLRQSQKLEAVGQLASGVAHDFNNLLGGIMGHAELLQMKLAPGSDLTVHTDRIIASCTKAAGLTRQLLGFARKAAASIQDVDLRTIIESVVDILQRTIDRRIEITTDLEGFAAIIAGDQTLLENAILNIGINARDAMRDGGRLTIRLRTVDLERDAIPKNSGDVTAGTYVRVSIADTGTGMSKEIQERIFEPFFTTKEVGKGTGLGLASVYGCIKQHHGYITVDSTEGLGSQFDLYLPVKPEMEPTGPDFEESPHAISGLTLMVVDDAVA